MKSELATSVTVRIDKWCWAARFFKTRTLASAAVERGKVRQNGALVKPAHAVRAGDVLEIDNGATRWEVLLIGVAELRGSAVKAQALYQETEKSRARRQTEAENRAYFTEPSATQKGRPTKRDRRQIDKSRPDS